MGQTFIEPAAGHVPKDGDIPGLTTTETALQMFAAARAAGDGCSPLVSRPHYAVVGTLDGYYGEQRGAYEGKALWEFMSTEVLGCTGSPTPMDGSAITGDASDCFAYPSCAGMDASLNKYCVVPGRGHETGDWAMALATGAGMMIGGCADVEAYCGHARYGSITRA